MLAISQLEWNFKCEPFIAPETKTELKMIWIFLVRCEFNLKVWFRAVQTITREVQTVNEMVWELFEQQNLKTDQSYNKLSSPFHHKQLSYSSSYKNVYSLYRYIFMITKYLEPFDRTLLYLLILSQNIQKIIRGLHCIL